MNEHTNGDCPDNTHIGQVTDKIIIDGNYKNLFILKKLKPLCTKWS